MPELPEVETTRRGVARYVTGRRIEGITIRERRLRWPIPSRLPRTLTGQRFQAPRRRGKYLLFPADTGTLIVHLGMSGSLRLVTHETPPGNHDHVDIRLEGRRSLRYNDPRRFGAILWTRSDPAGHPLLAELGPEPLEAAFDGAYLYATARGRRASIKQHLMNPTVVVGVGNIYANEALFRAGIHPARPAGRIGPARMQRLACAIREVLAEAIEVGGTTLRDYVGGNGEPGYFQLRLFVYDRAGEPCTICGELIRRRVIGQRSSYYCARCQR